MDTLMQTLEELVATNAELLALALVFLAVTLLAFGVLSWAFAGTDPARRRLRELEKPGSGPADAADRRKREPTRVGAFVVRWVEPVGKVLQPREGWQSSGLHTRLVQGGYRGPHAVQVFLGFKVVLLIVLPLAAAGLVLLFGPYGVLTDPLMILLLVLLAGIGFYLPEFMLARRTNQRQTAFVEGFPDAMDMLVVCVEAGLGLDAAIQRVGDEMMRSHPELGEEFHVMSLELRAGKTREAALRSLAKRTGIDEVQSLTTLLIQAEHFGTSIADALRERAESMRIERIQRAREKAAKLPVKMIIPIILFIFPALFLVILGPAVIRIVSGFFGVTG